jgi:lipopolysaccharide biosynthesis regulator YciM
VKDLPSLLLLGAFLAVGGAAWLLGRHGARGVRMPRDYFVGLDHLINDRFDRATEVFARMAESNGDSAEIQFALGSLFRRRGEVDRAIRIHTRLRAEQPAPVAEQASYALALDYLSAGLMDRAEQLLHEVAALDTYRAAALDQLLRVHEQQSDWAGALRIFQELPHPVQAERSRIAAHYLCELAELALAGRELARAHSLLDQARAREPRFPRAQRLHGRLAEADGRPNEAIERYLEAIAAAPQLVLEVAPRALALAAEQDRGSLLERIAAQLPREPPADAARLTWALAALVSRPLLEAAPELVALLRERLTAAAGTSAAFGDSVFAFVAFAHAAQEAVGRYQCAECGFRSVSWYWQCPGCRSWDAQQPLAVPWADAGMRSANV